ncbi:energy transducer TonB [Sphingomonas sp.]|uniref:energy transducer TonB n=1 Tax=Sphingomonas sp. TaxID=28214 RepID=UPI002ED94471
MYADRYHSTASRPAGAGAALLISGAMILGLYHAGPTIAPGVFADPPLVTKNIPVPKPPPPKPQPEEQQIEQRRTMTTPLPHVPDPVIDLAGKGALIEGTDLIGPATSEPPGPVGPAGGGVTLDPPRPPVMVAPSVDPKYADALQPPYPPAEIRRGTEGSVTARVLIGADGRVKAIDIVKSPSDGLSDATRRHALARWRFRPATRDGVPVEGWKTMTLRFQIVE